MKHNSKTLKALIVSELAQKPGIFKQRMTLATEEALRKSSIWKRVHKEVSGTCIERIFCPHGYKDASGVSPAWVDDVSVHIITNDTETEIIDFEFCVD